MPAAAEFDGFAPLWTDYLRNVGLIGADQSLTEADVCRMRAAHSHEAWRQTREAGHYREWQAQLDWAHAWEGRDT